MRGRLLVVATLGVLSSTYALANNAHVTDGDTITVGDTTHRLFGIDAPEAGQKCKSKSGGSWNCGQAAVSAMEALILPATSVECTSQGIDQYGRSLSVCLADGVDVNAEMVKQGLAWAFHKYSDKYANEEKQAQSQRIGIWQANNQPAWEYRAERWNVAVQEVSGECVIKGNINRKGEKIYHAPWSPWYNKTKISTKSGERWFCSEEEALKAGWRAPHWGR